MQAVVTWLNHMIERMQNNIEHLFVTSVINEFNARSILNFICLNSNLVLSQARLN